MQDRIFYVTCFGFLIGVFLISVFNKIFVSNIFLIYLLAFIFVLILFFFIFISKQNKWGIIFAVFILAISLGIFRFNFFDKNISVYLDEKIDEKVELVGIISDDVDMRDNIQKLIVEVKENKEKFKILLSTDFEKTFSYGDEIKFSGKLVKPENFITDQEKEFDYINYLRKDNILYLISYPKIKILENNKGNFVKANLFKLKNNFVEKINFLIPNPENLLMSGLILGEKSSFSEDLRQDFVDTGTIHIVALSGYNVTIIAEWIMKLFIFLPFGLGVWAGILAIILFVIMSGAGSTAVRAGIMAILMLFARATGRNYDVARALILAAVLMIFLNPLILVHDVSFQLSFIATVAVIFFTPKIEKYFTWITEKFGLRDIVTVTSAAYIFVLPFILYEMGNLSIVALPANVLVLPFIPFTMLLGFLSGIFSFIWYLLAMPFGYVAYFLLHYELTVIQFFGSLPFAAFTIKNFPLVITVLIYLYFIYLIFWKDIKKFFKGI
ncbi:MAG: ComEC/Rec2 family competence protein [Patescibacteria group bacterium]